MKMSHEEYIETKRKRDVEVASGMIDGTIHSLESAIELSSLRFEVGLSKDDKDFLASPQKSIIYRLVHQGNIGLKMPSNGTSQKYSNLLSGQRMFLCQNVNLS